MSYESEIRTLLTIHYNRWQKLRRYTPVSGHKNDLVMPMEIEDIEAEMKRLKKKLLQFHPNPQRSKVITTRHEEDEEQSVSEVVGPVINDPNNLLSAITGATTQATTALKAAKLILKVMFPNYKSVHVKQRLDDRAGESYTFLVRPFRPGNIIEISAVVKIASASLIKKEEQAYHNHVRDRWPNTAPMRAEPIFYDDWGGLCYPLRGDVKVVSLYDYACTGHPVDIRFILKERLLRLLKHVMQFDQQMAERFPFHASYDRLLPANLFVELRPEPFEVQPPTLTPVNLMDGDLHYGTPVRLERFMVSNVNPIQRTVDLTLPPAGYRLPRSYCIRLQATEEMPVYRVGQVIDAVEGNVIQTRQERLVTETKQILGQAVDLAGESLISLDGTKLPNPLIRWSIYLNQVRSVKVGTINGGLTGQNILVDKDVRDVYFTSFVETRCDHLLHDFLQLETEILTKLLPDILAKCNLEAALILPFYKQLHRAITHFEFPEALPHPDLDKPFEMLTIIRQAARNYFVDHEDWSEYYEGLVLYLLGMLKQCNSIKLGSLPKQVAFWGAAVTCQLVDEL